MAYRLSGERGDRIVVRRGDRGLNRCLMRRLPAFLRCSRLWLSVSDLRARHPLLCVSRAGGRGARKERNGDRRQNNAGCSHGCDVVLERYGTAKRCHSRHGASWKSSVQGENRLGGQILDVAAHRFGICADLFETKASVTRAMPADLHRLRERRVAACVDGNLQFLHFLGSCKNRRSAFKPLKH